MRALALLCTLAACASTPGPRSRPPPPRPAGDAVAYTTWDCRRECAEPTELCLAPTLDNTAGLDPTDAAGFEAAFGCSTGIDFAAQRPILAVGGGTNAYARIGSVTRADSTITVEVVTDHPCRGAVEDAFRIMVILVPAGPEAVKFVNRSTVERCGEVAPP